MGRVSTGTEPRCYRGIYRFESYRPSQFRSIMTENSNSKAFGVKDLQPNKSHLVPGKTGDGKNSDPLTTAMHPRDEIDALIAEGKRARGEKADVVYDIPRHVGDTVRFPSGIVISEQIIEKDFDGRLADLEKQVEELTERLVKAFKHAGFEF